MNDGELLSQYVEEGAEPAFEELVKRHADLVYSSALRRVGSGLADDVTQAVFVVLARKAPRLVGKKVTNLTGWLFRTTRYAALDALRRQKRQEEREKAAAEERRIEMEANHTSREWEQLRPVLDEAMDRLSKGDRDAVLLRFFRGASFAEVGDEMGIPENTAAKRVSRALQKLHGFLTRKGISLSVPVMASLLASESTEAVPGEIAELSAATALAGSGVIAGGATVSALLIADGAMKTMFVNQVATAAVAGCVLLTAGAGTAVTVNHVVAASSTSVINCEEAGIRVVSIRPAMFEFMAMSTLPDGAQEFQINTRGNDRTYFVRLGEKVEGFTVVHHEARSEQREVAGIGRTSVVNVSELTLERGRERLVLTRNRPAKSSGITVHMVVGSANVDHFLGVGDRFDLDGTEYQVAEVPPKLDRVVLRRTTDGREAVLSAGE